MHIKSIQLDGFKSYQKTTEITGFSDTFNAITGYNGSGKSNILDSICFILGISKLDTIRAKNMNELISHGGTKATVQIRFDNTQKALSPFGMENLDEIVVQRTITNQAAGKGCSTTYTLNGHAATNGKITDFFRNIGLNVNNPHFLIMQGRITTVLNMKPEEILGMIEEAAGTKMYDQKKREAEKTMFLKEARIREIDNIFEVSINPRMEKFREDRKNMVEVTRLTKLRENSLRKYEAFEYYQTLEDAKKNAERMKTSEKELEKLSSRIEEITNDIQKKEKEKVDLDALTQDKNAEKSAMEEYRNIMSKKATAENNKGSHCDKIANCEKEYERLRQSIAKDRKVLESKRKELENTRRNNEEEINRFKDDEALVVKYRDDLESLTRGTVANEQGVHVSIEHEIQDCRTKSAALDAQIKTARNRRERVRPRIAHLEKEHAVLAGQNSSELNELTAVNKEITDLKARIENSNYNNNEETEKRERATTLKNQIMELENEKNKLLTRNYGSRYLLNYTMPPVHDFDPRKDVIGFIAHLTFMKPGAERYAVAVEIAVQGLLSQIVVRNQDVARILIDSKAFNTRRTMIPISENHRKSGRIISDKTLSIGKQIAARKNETCIRLIDVVDYPQCVSNTYVSVLGHILVVDTLETARTIAYHPDIKTRVITTRGDDVKPNGIMSGGFNDNGDKSTLLTLAPLKEINIKINALSDEYEPLQEELKTNEALYMQHQNLTDSLMNAERKLAQVKNNIKNSTLGIAQKDLEDAKKDLEEVEASIVQNSKQLAILQEKVKNLEMMKSDDKNSQEKRKKELQAMLNNAEKKIAQNKDKAESAKRAVMQIAATVDDLEQGIKNDELELEKKQKDQDKLKEDLPELETELARSIAEEGAILKRLEDFKNSLRQRSGRVAKLNKEMDNLKRDEAKTKKQREEKEKDVRKFGDLEKENHKTANALLQKCEWIADEQVHFNKKGGMYDFEGYSLHKGSTEVKELADRIEKLERCLSMKNVSNLDTCEAKVMDIKNKRERLTNDFDMLRKTIALLDKRKIEELKRAHRSVNEDFGKIFSCLLPDAYAQLVPPEGRTVYEGLEVKVSFNGVVKDSLHELSGGQRSLVALSLILAMLKFKPAPLYILDEVDAALDLSHTANIGMMIRRHFQNSQFIIVSLKQGMFSNADVIFQTNFADGHSSCTRLVGAALEKLKNDKKLAAQAIEADVAVKTQDKPKKKSKKRTQEADVDMVDVDAEPSN